MDRAQADALAQNLLAAPGARRPAPVAPGAAAPAAQRPAPAAPAEPMNGLLHDHGQHKRLAGQGILKEDPPARGEGEQPHKKKAKDAFTLDPSLLKLSEEEEEWAITLREAIDGLPDLDIHFTDFMVAHLAIAGKGNLEWAIERAYKMQDVQKEYKIRGTYEEGCAAIKALFELQPNCILNFSCDPASGECLVMIEGTHRVKEQWKSSQKNVDITIRGAYYLSYAEHPSLECVRVGNLHFFEMDGFQWGSGVTDGKEFAKLTNETVSTFPNVLQHTKFYNTPMMANCMVSMVKKLIPKDVASKFSFGHTFAEGRTLRNFYLVPTPEAASQKAYNNLCRALKLRFESEETFSLDS